MIPTPEVIEQNRAAEVERTKVRTLTATDTERATNVHWWENQARTNVPGSTLHAWSVKMADAWRGTPAPAQLALWEVEG